VRIHALAPLAFALLVVPAFAPSAFAEPPARVELCHVPPGDPDAPQTITVSEKALAAHLNHGDLEVACDDACFSDPGACDDANACTSDSCDGGRCSNEPLPAEACDDAEVTTTDRCEPATGCVNDCVGQPTEPCGFADGEFALEDPETSSCEPWPSVQISIKFEADVLDPDDVVLDPAALEALKPALIAEVQSVFASFTPISITIECAHIAMAPDSTLSWFGQLVSVDLVTAIDTSALPPGATESTVVSKIQTEFGADPSLFDALEAVLTDALGNGAVPFSYVTVNVY
jgi:hypothetical protein